MLVEKRESLGLLGVRGSPWLLGITESRSLEVLNIRYFALADDSRRVRAVARQHTLDFGTAFQGTC